jgi:hypothetical protein
MKEIRANIAKIRTVDPNLADRMEAGYGKPFTTTQNYVRLGAALAETALTLIPVAGEGRAILGAGEATLATKLGTKGATLAMGGGIGGTYNMLDGLTRDPSWSNAARDFAVGSAFGTTLTGVGLAARPLMALTGRGVEAATGAVKYATNAATDTFPALKNLPEMLRPSNRLPLNIYKQIFTQGSALKNYYGEIGDNFVRMYKSATDLAHLDLGRLNLNLIDHGFVQAPLGTRRVFGNVEYIGGDAERMGLYNRILEGRGIYADRAVQAEAIAADPHLTFLDSVRQDIGARSQKGGIVDSLLNMDTYFPRSTPLTLLKSSTASKIAATEDPVLLEKLYAANDPVMKDMVEHAVYETKEFPTLLEGYKYAYDLADFVEQGGRVAGRDNSALQRMVMKGEATSIDDAAGKLIEDMKYRKQSLTPQASSLDFKRKIELPIYDPNPARVIPAYAHDAAGRIAMTQTFGKNDEVIREMIGKIKNSTAERGVSSVEDAKQFEQIVRTITGQVERSPAAERASSFIRALQVPKLAFAQILNIGQNVNYLLATDLGSSVHGIQAAFREQGIRDAIESGALLNSLLRDVYSYSGGGSKFADKLLTWSGFTTTEIFNRTVGASVAKEWATKQFMQMAKNTLLEGVEGKRLDFVKGMLADKQAWEAKSLRMGLDIQQEYMAKFKELFPEDKFDAVVGNLGAVKRRLAQLEDESAPRIANLQKTKDLLEKQLKQEAAPLTEQAVADLKESIDFLKKSIAEVTPASEHVPLDPTVAPAREFTPQEVQDALNAATGLRRSEMEDMVQRLEAKLYEKLPDGTNQFGDAIDAAGNPIIPGIPPATEAPKVAPIVRAPETPEVRIAGIHADIKAADAAILQIQNDIGEKQSLLSAILDSYKIAEERALKDFPGAAAYDRWIAGRKEQLAGAPVNMKFHGVALRELGIDPEAALHRGFLTDQELQTAGARLVEKTQFNSNPMDLPAFASSPAGKVVFQFKTFAYQQMKFVYHEFERDLSAGPNGRNFARAARNLVVLSTVYPMTGEVLADIRSLITGDRRPTGIFERYLSDLASAGAFGMAYDFINASLYGKTAEFIGGPTAGDLTKYLESATQAVFGGHKTGLKNFTKQLLTNTGVGRIINPLVFPSNPSSGKETVFKTLTGLGGN